MSQAVPALVHFILVVAIAWAIVCRARLMTGATYRAVRLQHGGMFAAAVFSLGVPAEWRGPVIAAGVAAWLILSSARWRHEAPAGTSPAPLDEAQT